MTKLVSSAKEMIEILESRGGGSYFGEPVTVLEHCLQAAYFAAKSGAGSEQTIAALLHDVGHLLHDEPEDVAEQGEDMRHEELGQQILAEHLPPAVTEPVRLHVTAKRYLCFADPSYLGVLSPSSLLSLELQGGPMQEQEAQTFLVQPYARQAIELRHWDDQAKIPGLPVPAAKEYLSLLQPLWR